MATLNCILHPHHVSLARNPWTVQSLFHSFEDRIDPYYSIDGSSSHKGLGRPRFNVTETETSYILDGEFPGIRDKNQISVEWLLNQVLIIRGTVGPADTETATDPFEKGLQNDLPAVTKHVEVPTDVAKLEIVATTPKQTVKYPRHLLNERRLGECQRSFTFPVEVDADNMKASLSDGLLRIVVPKKSDAVSNAKTIAVQ